jgi:hypothetical protein
MYDGKADRQIKRQQIEDYSAQRKIDETVVKVIASVTNVNMDIFEKEDVTMCELWEEVKAEGKAEGKSEGEDKLARLINRLISDKRLDDVSKASNDKTIRQALYKEYGITD